HKDCEIFHKLLIVASRFDFIGFPIYNQPYSFRNSPNLVRSVFPIFKHLSSCRNVGAAADFAVGTKTRTKIEKEPSGLGRPKPFFLRRVLSCLALLRMAPSLLKEVSGKKNRKKTHKQLPA